MKDGEMYLKIEVYYAHGSGARKIKSLMWPLTPASVKGLLLHQNMEEEGRLWPGTWSLF